MITQTDSDPRLKDAVDTLDDLDMSDIDDTSDLRAIGNLVDAIAQDEMDLAVAVKTARTRGRSWTAIGLALGVTRQAAHDRFARR